MFLRTIQQECDTFVTLWNSRRTRLQNNLELPNDIPNHIFSFPEQCDGTQKCIKVKTEFSQELSTQSGLNIDNRSIVYDFMDEEFLTNIEHFLPNSMEIPSMLGFEPYFFMQCKLRI